MSDDLHNQLRQLHDQIDPSVAKDPQTKVKMGYMKDRVGELVNRTAEEPTPGDHEGLIESLEDAFVHLEAEHPTLAGLIRGIINSLSNSGI